MRNYLAYSVLGLVFLGGVVFMISLALKPRPVPKIKPSVFRSTTIVANSILLSVGRELEENSIVLFGLEPNKPDFTKVVQDFIQAQPAERAFQNFIVDKNLERMNPELSAIQGERLDTQADFAQLEPLLRKYNEAHSRVLVVMPAPFAASSLAASPAAYLKERGLPFMSLLLMSFPRTREAERDVFLPCMVTEEADTRGTGKLGCEVLSFARTNYKRKFDSGELVGFMYQISQNDYLFLLTREP